jgi:hypothetical protein
MQQYVILAPCFFSQIGKFSISVLVNVNYISIFSISKQFVIFRIVKLCYFLPEECKSIPFAM